MQRRQSPLRDGRHGPIKPRLAHAVRCQESQIPPERGHHRLDVRTGASLSLCEDYSPDKLGGIGSGIITEAGKQLHDHVAVGRSTVRSEIPL